jgi:hypothetical protein
VTGRLRFSTTGVTAPDGRSDDRSHSRRGRRGRAAELQQLLPDTEHVDQFLQRLVVLAVDALPGDVSCGLTLRRGRRPMTVASSDNRANLVDEVQYGFDDGPPGQPGRREDDPDRRPDRGRRRLARLQHLDRCARRPFVAVGTGECR